MARRAKFTPPRLGAGKLKSPPRQVKGGGYYYYGMQSNDDVAEIRAHLSRMSSVDMGPPLQVRSTLRPCIADGLPVLGAVRGYSNTVYLAAGHDPWGILWGPISGLAMAQLILQNDVSGYFRHAFNDFSYI